MKQIFVPLDVQGKITDVHFYVGEPSSFVASPLQFQQGWLKQQRGLPFPRELVAFYSKIKTLAEARNAELPATLMQALPRIKAIAAENNVSFAALCGHTLTPEEVTWIEDLEGVVPSLQGADPEAGKPEVQPRSARRKFVEAFGRSDKEVPPITDAEMAEVGDEEIVLLLDGFNNFGDKIYNYLKLPLKKIEPLMVALDNGGKFDLQSFGEVIAAGLGSPPPEVREEIESQYKIISRGANSETPS